jgi:DNA invertase Pin-like site-specific DNA recombinase
MPKAILYARVSSKEQAEGYSVDSQLYRLRKEVPERGYEMAREVVDVGYERETLFRHGLGEIPGKAAKGDIGAVYPVDAP